MTCAERGCELVSRSAGLCSPHYSRRWRAANAARKKTADAAWREANREKLRQDAAAYRKTPAKAEADRRWREANRQADSERRMAWDKAHPERLRERMQGVRAMRRGAFVETVDLAELWARDNGECQICCEPIDAALAWPHAMARTLDHIIPLSRGGTHELKNAQLAHFLCNTRKGNKLLDGARPLGQSPAMEE